jgi:hypothetical protein
MPPPTDELLQRMAQSAATWPHGRLEQLLREARSEAEAEVKDLLKSAIKAALLREAAEVLDPRTESASTEEPIARYVYCILPAGGAPLPDNLPGVGDTDQFDIVRDGSVVAVTSPVGESDFDREAMARRLADPRWLEADVRAHEAVIRAAMSAGPIIPLRFATVLRSRDDVLRVMETHQQAIQQTLHSLRGKKEWGVKIVQRADGDPGAEIAAQAAATARSGRDYLASKQQHWRSRSELNRAAFESAQECHRILAEIAQQATELPTENCGGEGRLLLNGAYLVPDEQESQFHSTVAALGNRLAAAGLACEVTGPWPAYNFVNLDLSLPASG